MSAPLEWYKGVAYYSEDNIAAATHSFEKAYRYHPYNIHIDNNLASCYEKKAEHKKAVVFYKKALYISPHFEETILNLSAVYYNMKDYKKAFETINQLDCDTLNTRYLSYLPAILKSYLTETLSNLTGNEKKNKLTELIGSDEEIIKLYFESRRKNIIFDQYIKSHEAFPN